MAKGKPGRPTRWTERVNQEMVEFFDIEPYRELNVLKERAGKVYEVFQLLPNKLPMFGAFERSKGLSHGSLAEWAKKENLEKYPGFSDAYKHCKELQKEFLIQNGLAGLYPAPSWIFTAKNVTDMRDEQHLKHGGEGENGEIVVKLTQYGDHDSAPVPTTALPTGPVRSP